MDGLSIPVTASNLNAPSCSVAEDVTKGGDADNSINILDRYASRTPAGSLRASTSDLVSGVATKPSLDFGGDALQEAATVNRLMIPVTANRGGNGAGL